MADLVRKLLLKPGNRVLVMDAPAGFLGQLWLDELVVETKAGDVAYDAVILFAHDRHAADEGMPAVVSYTTPGGLAWLAYRKTPNGDLNRRGVWEIVEPRGWLPVSQIAIDETWTAMRLRPREDVGK
jgi:hypothetical protein